MYGSSLTNFFEKILLFSLFGVRKRIGTLGNSGKIPYFCTFKRYSSKIK
jgi:hypothetical protein